MEKRSRKTRTGEGVEEPSPTVLFDGVCNLCNSFINFIIDWEKEDTLRFGSLQSEKAGEVLEQAAPNAPINPDALDSIIFVEQGGRVYTHSTAVLRILTYLHVPWNLLYGLIIVPRAVRDWIYNQVGSNRYNWFGRRRECRVPTPALRDRFIDG
jgi:predicted DCC family thiol-disulfide oxidoreductase YuxK